MHCASPVACSGWGYCRIRNLTEGVNPTDPDTIARFRAIAAERNRPVDQATIDNDPTLDPMYILAEEVRAVIKKTMEDQMIGRVQTEVVADTIVGALMTVVEVFLKTCPDANMALRMAEKAVHCMTNVAIDLRKGTG